MKGTAINKYGDSKTDYCASGGLYEHFCREDYPGYVGIEYAVCPNGCENGACVDDSKTCTDSDGGKNIFVKGPDFFRLVSYGEAES